MNVIDLFAGPGGWDVAARRLGFDPVGIEYDFAACQTREAAGLRTLFRDVATMDPRANAFGVFRDRRLDGLIASWVSMAQALGWDRGDLVGFPRRADGRESVVIGDDEYRARDLRPADDPAFNLTEKARSWTRLRQNARANATERAMDEPAPTITGGKDHGERMWVHDRPATTVAGDPRIHPPGHKINQDDIDAGRTHYHGRRGAEAIRVTVEEAAVLQAFPADYPFQGSKTKRFEQVGNAVPPLLAEAVLRQVVA